MKTLNELMREGCKFNGDNGGWLVLIPASLIAMFVVVVLAVVL